MVIDVDDIDGNCEVYGDDYMMVMIEGGGGGGGGGAGGGGGGQENLVWLIVDAEQRTFKISEAWEGKC